MVTSIYLLPCFLQVMLLGAYKDTPVSGSACRELKSDLMQFDCVG